MGDRTAPFSSLFRLRENTSYRQKLNLTITADEPQALTEFENEDDQPLGFVIDDTIHTGQALGHTCAKTTESFVNSILAKRGFVIQHIGLQDKQIALDGYSVFRDAKLVGFIPVEGSRGLSYLLSSQPIWVYRLPGEDGFITAEVELARRDIKPSHQDGVIRFQVQIALTATIQYKSDASLFINEQSIRKFSDNLKQVLSQEIRRTIDDSQRLFQSDYLNFGEVFRVAFPDKYERMDWTKEYPKAEIEAFVSVDVSVSDKIDIEAS